LLPEWNGRRSKYFQRSLFIVKIKFGKLRYILQVISLLGMYVHFTGP
jgi:hypothetical protein